jgi:hypothetical protein
MSESILDCLSNSEKLARLFWILCDFQRIDEAPPGWFRLASGEPLKVVARDGAGGRFCLLPRSATPAEGLLYVSSEGQAGVIAASLAEGLQMMIALPCWRDSLKFSRGGDLDEMRKVQARQEVDLQNRRYDLESVRKKLYRAFGLAAPADPVALLHRAVTQGTGAKVVSPKDGNPFEALFG